MRIVEVRECAVPLHTAVANSVVNFSGHDVSLVAVFTDEVRQGSPVIGVAFDSIGRFAQSGLIRERFAPRLLAADPDAVLDATGAFDPSTACAVMMAGEKQGGHGDRAAAVGAVELALWDANAKLAEEPAYRTIARAAGRSPGESGVEVYAAGGYYTQHDTADTLANELRAYVDQGYDSVKIKIAGATLSEDMRRLEAACSVFPAGRIAVDANGRLSRDQALVYAKHLGQLGLRWFEEPCEPLDYALHAELIQVYGERTATGENLFSAQDVRNLVRYAGVRPAVDIFQMDPALSYGLSEYLEMLTKLSAFGHDRRQLFPHGGHLLNLHIVAGLGLGGCEAYPGMFSPFGGYSAECVMAEARMWPGQSPGFGLEAKADLMPHIDKLVSG